MALAEKYKKGDKNIWPKKKMKKTKIEIKFF